MSAICRVCGNPIGLGAVSGCCSKKCNDSIDRKWGLWKKVKAAMMTVFILLAAYAVVVMVSGCVGVTTPTAPTITDMVMHPSVKVILPGSSGSGVVIYSKDYTLIITAGHVVKGDIRGKGVKVILNGETHEAFIVKKGDEHDFSVLRVEAQTDYVAHTHDMTLEYLMGVVVVGAGLGLKSYISAGVVSNPYFDIDKQFQLSVATAVGMSGAGVYVRHQEHFVLVGMMVTMGMQRVVTRMFPLRLPIVNIAFAIPVSAFKGYFKGIPTT